MQGIVTLHKKNTITGENMICFILLKKNCPCSKIIKTSKIEVTYLALVDPFCQSSINIYLKYHTNSKGLLPIELYTIKNYSLGKFVTSNFSFFL